jgi:hypothetical protein
MGFVVDFVNRPKEFWRVNSYSYPSFFSDNAKAEEAWEVLSSFLEYEEYDKLKEFWTSPKAPRRLSPQALESWKATFEECGFLYVISRSNKVTITPAGKNLFEFANVENKNEFVWTGLNLLLRYPLKGPRKPRNAYQGNSDLFLYRFLFSALIELDNYIWWSELERILCRVFRTEDASSAIEEIRELRKVPSRLLDIELPVFQRKGAFYNSLNQVANHASMNHLILETNKVHSPYSDFSTDEANKRISIRPEWLGLIKKALIAENTKTLCHSSGSYINALPSCPMFANEADFFNFIGAKTLTYDESHNQTLIAIEFNGEQVHYLIEKEHYTKVNPNKIIGQQNTLCQLSKGQRIILSSNEKWTYFVLNKTVRDHLSVEVTIRRGRPISNFNLLKDMIENTND